MMKNQTKTFKVSNYSRVGFVEAKYHFLFLFNTNNEHQTASMSHQTILDRLFQKGEGGCVFYPPFLLLGMIQPLMTMLYRF